MHTFQPYPVDLVEFNPFNQIGKNWALISAGNKADYNTMTVSWGGLGVIWNKNVAYIFIRESRHTKHLIDEGDFFTVAFMDEKYREAMNYCGSHSGRDTADKFSDSGLTAAFKFGIPYPDEANFVILCRKMAAVPIDKDSFIDSDIEPKFYPEGDFHTMYIGEVIEIMAR